MANQAILPSLTRYSYLRPVPELEISLDSAELEVKLFVRVQCDFRDYIGSHVWDAQSRSAVISSPPK